MFADPLVTNVCFLSRTMPRVSIAGQSAVYKSPDGVGTVKVSHTTSKNRTRSLVRFEGPIVGTNPLTAANTTGNAVAYLVIDYPSQSVFTDTNGGVKEVAKNLMSFLTASSDAALIKVLGTEI